METAGDILKQAMKDPKRGVIISGADVYTREGWTGIPNHLLTSEKITPGAKLVYITLLKYDWYNRGAFPGQERLAKDTGLGLRTVTRHIKELSENKYITVHRRGQGKTNLYELHVKVSK